MKMMKQEDPDKHYSAEEISHIKAVASQYHATEFVQPTFHLVSILLFILAVLALIHKLSWKKQKKYIIGSVLVLSLLLLRMFMMFHDLCHKSYFPSNERETKTQGLNFAIAKWIEVLNLFEAQQWQEGHSNHHVAQGNLNYHDSARTLITSSEYEKLPRYKQLLYNVFRNPLIFFIVSPIYIFWISKFLYEWVYLVKYTIFLGLLYYIGKFKLVAAFFIAQYITAIVGLMLFHLQHQVNVGYWKRIADNDQNEKANADLRGASVLKIPWVFEYFTNGIEYHNVHHTDPGIPSYRIKSCYYELVRRGLIPDNKIGYLKSFKSLFHEWYNEKTQRYESNSFFSFLGLQG
jgi:omega-6 fatty acid desaturase (delta-12 desaturase)